MRRLFVVLVVLVIGVAVLGYYRGWFTFEWEKTPDGNSQIIGTVNHNKIEEDKKQAAEKLQDLRRPSDAKASEKNQNRDGTSKQP
jgi:hypothetical protein